MMLDNILYFFKVNFGFFLYFSLKKYIFLFKYFNQKTINLTYKFIIRSFEQSQSLYYKQNHKFRLIFYFKTFFFYFYLQYELSNYLMKSIKIKFFNNFILKMSSSGGNPSCSVQDCSDGCCNKYGTCPSSASSYSSSSYKTCKYYYTTNTSGGSAQVVALTVGPIVGFVILMVILTCCIRRCKQKRLEQIQRNQANRIQSNNHNPNHNITIQQLNTEYTDPNQVFLQNQNYGQSYGQPYVQPAMMMQSPIPPIQPPIPPMMQQPVYTPQQALFGQPMQPPIYQNYGPNPIMH